MHRPKLKSSQLVHKGYCSVFVDHMEIESGALYPYTRLEFGFDASAVLAETAEGLLLINKEFRYPTRTHLYSCSGGKIDPGEDPVQGAKRELLEETGYTSDLFLSLGALYPFPALSSQRIHYFLAKNARLEQSPTREPLEDIECHLITEAEIQEHIRSGAPVDGILCTALYLKSIHSNQS